MKPDPRACRDPFPFTSHLTVAEVDTYERLLRKALRGKALDSAESARLNYLGRRRLISDVPVERGGVG